jgi:hypothetical protein
MSELFGQAAEKASGIGALGLCGGVNGAEVASQSRLGTGGDQDGWVMWRVDLCAVLSFKSANKPVWSARSTGFFT